MPAAAVAKRKPATGGISGIEVGARGEMVVDMKPSCAGLTRAPMLRASVPLSAMDCRVKPGNVEMTYFFAGAAGLSEDGSTGG